MYRLTEPQQTIVERARALADASIGPQASRVDKEGTFPIEGLAALGSAGFLGLTISPEFGGMGQGIRVASAVLEEIGQRCASTGMVYLMHLAGIACYNAAPENTANLLKSAAKGDHLSTLAWSERGSRSHFWAPVSRAIAENGHVKITAQKSFVTSAGHADGYVVSTQSSTATTPMDSMLCLVLRDDPGMAVAGQWDALGMRGNASAPVTLEDLVVADDRVLAPAGKGLQTMLGVVLPLFQVGNAALSVGIAEAAVRTTQNHLTSAHFAHLNSNLAALPTLRARLAAMRIATDTARAHLVCTLDAIENGSATAQLMVLEVKAVASEAAVAVTDLGMRACGGVAFGKQLPLERLFRDARASVVMSPTTEHAHEFIGRALCGMEVF